MSFDASSYVRDPKDAPEQEHQQGSWLENNVINPAINGSGVIQIYNTFAHDKAQLKQTAPAELGSAEWATQTLAGAAGAIIPYVLAGKVAGKFLGVGAEKLGLTGASAKFATSAAVANIVGAGAYDLLKAPNPGETRLSNAAGTMAGFTVFEAGNHFLGKGTRMLGNPALRMTATVGGRAAVGALGGLTSFDTSHGVAALMGEKNDQTWTMNHRIEAMAGGAFLNVTLPVVNEGVTRAVDYAYTSRPYGPGLPVDRFMKYRGIEDPALLDTARSFNPNARIKMARDGITSADVKSNTVLLGTDISAKEMPGKIAHELRHLRIARELEPQYKAVAQAMQVDPSRARNQFINMRHFAEFQARLHEAIFSTKHSVNDVQKIIETAGDIPNLKANNGQTYASNWEGEWKQFQQNRRFRPRFEYSEAPYEKAPSEGAAPVKVTESTKPETRNIVVTDAAHFGSPEPLGATVSDKGINFAIRSQSATKMELLLFDNSPTATKPEQTLAMNRTGDVWHRFEPGVGDGQTYLYRAFGEYNPAISGSRFNGNMGLIDPYAKAITGDSTRPVAYDNTNPNDPTRHLRVGEGDKVEGMSKNVAVRDNFDWKGDQHPNTPMEESFIYELNVKGFTGGVEELGKLRGTYAGLVEKIPHLKRLGVTAVELMPVFQFEKIDNFNGTMTEVPVNPENGKPLRNQWGYQTIGYQAPEASYSASGTRGQQVAEFKSMVQNLHANGIEVILDVVFNHTAEDGNLGPTISFRGLDNKVYYMLAPDAPEKYIDHTGCRNTLNVNEPHVRELILDTLRYWRKEMHVDGFRFDLATVFHYDVDNVDKGAKAPIMREIETDPVLKDVKLIAEPWSIDQYKVGKFAETRWAEWNGVFRDTVRKFLKSDSGTIGDLAERITGSRKWYDAQKGRHSINFVTAHDGFRMEDLFSYNEKHNFGNGEGNRDGANDNYSWNHGVEGPVERANIPEAMKVAIETMRARQVKNAFALLLLSQGTPMMLSGDEFRQSSHGNNNYWPQEDLNQLNWELAHTNADTVRFVELMSALRKEFKIGWRKPQDVTWHGTKPLEQHWGEHDRYIGWELPPTEGQPKRLYSGFNSYWEPLEVELPAGKWRIRMDTSQPKGQEIFGPGQGTTVIEGGGKYTVGPRSGVVFESILDNPNPQ